MARIVAPLFALTATPALAHPGFHPNPHGVEFGWIAAAVIGGVAAYLLQWVRK
ncbi:peptidase M23 [Paragemmobacter straminiformis]|uniref:Peptidase M23 n=1 Tax=Paragemmobacter straminiformis TaxID=2045119 RepID=A0A842I966_9RHOB|nr:peptidase M23 [Gemmobacter straminiformis]MBC2836592.1 peptidase M23 [Gemmobacter straminiformis]